MDWVLHDCPNKYTLDAPIKGHLVPYHYEDQMSHQELKLLPMSDPVFAAYSVQYNGPDR